MQYKDGKRLETFARIQQFGAESAADFLPLSIGATQFTEITNVVDLLNQLAADQAGSFGDARFGFVGKDSARENIREDLSDIARTARAMNYQITGISDKFRMPRGNNDQQLLAAARAFFTDAAAYQSEFVAYGLPIDFLQDLQSDINAFEINLGTTGGAIDAQTQATAAIGAAIRRGMIARRILDGVVKNKYRNDVGKLAAWTSAGHIEKTAKKKDNPPAA
jgi:hypothetical protein